MNMTDHKRVAFSIGRAEKTKLSLAQNITVNVLYLQVTLR